MKVFFGPNLQDMLVELRAAAVPTVRLQVLPHVEGKDLRLQAFVTTFYNNQIYEAVIETHAELAGVPPARLQEFISSRCAQAREKIGVQLTGLEVRKGVLQE